MLANGDACPADKETNVISRDNFEHDLFEPIMLELNANELNSTTFYAGHAYLVDLLNSTQFEQQTTLSADVW